MGNMCIVTKGAKLRRTEVNILRETDRPFWCGSREGQQWQRICPSVFNIFTTEQNQENKQTKIMDFSSEEN